MKFRALFYLLLCFALGCLILPAFPQASPYSNNVYKTQTFSATGQTGATIQLNGLSIPSNIGSSYSSGSITVVGTSLTSVTFGVQGSSDGGANFYSLPISSIGTPGTYSSTVTATSNGLYQINLAGITHLRFVTSGTFSATNVSLTLTASPNASIAKGGGGGGASYPGVTSDGANGLTVAGALTVQAKQVCLADGTHCPSSGGSSTYNVVTASSLNCPTPGVDLIAGKMPDGSTPTDATACLSAALAAATPSNPIALVLDKRYYGGIYGPAGGGWSIVAAHPGGIARVPISAWSCTGGSPNTCTFTTAAGNGLTAGQYVNLGLFPTNTSFNQTIWHVISTGLSSAQFEATGSVAATGSATESAEADFFYGDGLFAPTGLNNDVIHNGPQSSTGLCVSNAGSLWSDPGWTLPGPAPARGGEGISVSGIVINGNRGNGTTTGNSTGGVPTGSGGYVTTYGAAYCSLMNINIVNAENVHIDGIVTYNSPAYNIRLMNVGHAWVTNSDFQSVLPNGPAPSRTGGLQQDGVHISAPADHIYLTNDYFETSDDPWAANAAEGYVGLIEDVNVSNSSFHNSFTGGRMYTASVAPPAGDATPLVKRVSISNYSGDATAVAFIFGLQIGGARTFTIPNSMDDIKWTGGTVSGTAQGFVIDDSIGTLSLSGVTQKDIGCQNGTTGFFQNFINANSVASLSVTDSRLIFTTANHCEDAFIYDGGSGSGGLQFGTLTLNGVGVDNASGSNTLPQLLDLRGGSTVGNFYANAVNYANIGQLIPSGQISKINTLGGDNRYTNSHASGAQAIKTFHDLFSGAQYFEAPYALSSTEDSYNMSLARDAATGAFPLTNRNAAYLQIYSNSGGQSSAFLFGTGTAVNTMPPFTFKVGNGVTVGSTRVSYYSDPGDGNLLAGGLFAGNGNLKMQSCPWATAYNCVIFNGATGATAAISFSGGGPSDPDFYMGTPGKVHVQSGGVDTLSTGYATAPTGGCSTGSWALSQDGKLSFCKAGTWELVTAAP